MLLVVFMGAVGMPGSAFDFGLVMGQSGEFSNANPAKNDGEFNYAGTYLPWFSSELGETAKLYLSAKISTIYEYGKWKPENPPLLFEPGRFEFSWRPLPFLYLEAGRVQFQDPAGIVASGLFDGLSGSAVVGRLRLSGHVLYTGFLYKETAKIIMTSGDAASYLTPFEFGNFNSYTASRRMLVSLGAEFSDLTPRTTLALNVLAQFDINDRASPGSNDKLHTQYLMAHYTAFPLETLDLTGDLIIGLAENQGNDVMTHFAASLGLGWKVPGALPDMLQGEIRWSSGVVNKNIMAFAPVNSIPQGQVFSPRLSGLMTVKGNYTVRPHSTFSTSLALAYFIRTDGETLIGVDFPASDKRLLGGELYGTLLWAPKSDLVLTLGGGLFLPGIGDVFIPGAPVQGKIVAGIVLSL